VVTNLLEHTLELDSTTQIAELVSCQNDQPKAAPGEWARHVATIETSAGPIESSSGTTEHWQGNVDTDGLLAAPGDTL
jgi:hypothetical protein